MFISHGVARAGVVSFTDYDAFAAAVGEVRVIDFDTLPDGSPSYSSAPITPEFNYGDQGVIFSAPIDSLFLAGNSSSGYSLATDGYPDTNTWITTTLATPAYGVGIHANGTFFSAFDDRGHLLGRTLQTRPGFLGLVSDRPIWSAVIDRGDEAIHVSISDFVFSPVPEPATLLLLMTGAVALARRRPKQ